jgi:tRNA dimethylallyltransferase
VETVTKPLIVIVGQTASGKSALGLKLAQQFGGEIICADSWTVYRDFDIGTAKPSPAEQRAVPHHLLDVADPQAGFSAVLFQQYALRALDDIAARGKLAFMVGGTGLYVDSVLYKYGFLPPADPALRAELAGKTLAELLDIAARKQLDTSQVDTRNKRRVIRLIESEGQIPKRQSLRDNTLILGVQPDAAALRQRIAQRVDRMIEAGLEQEVRRLVNRYGWGVEPMKGIGYAEWRPYIEGTQTLTQTRDRIISNSMGLAKRQRTWFKRNQTIVYPSNYDEYVECITTFLNTSS